MKVGILPVMLHWYAVLAVTSSASTVVKLSPSMSANWHWYLSLVSSGGNPGVTVTLSFRIVVHKNEDTVKHNAYNKKHSQSQGYPGQTDWV